MSFDTGTPLRDFDMVAFSVSFENDYLHVLKVLRLAGIPLRAKDRGPRDPLVVLGGAAIFLNPEPLAALRRSRRGGRGRGPRAEDDGRAPRRGDAADGPRRRCGRRTASTFRRRYEVRYHPDGTVAAYDGPGTVVRQRGWPGKMPMPQSVILTPHTEMSMKFMVEISRGCPCMCRFCWAGYNYLPVRGFSRQEIVDRAREVRRHTQKIGLVSTAVCDHPEIDGIVDDLAGLDYQVSVASLRLDDLTPEFVLKLADTGVEGLTLAPECGSDRMRKILNKQFTNDDILDRAEWIFENGIQNLKLYYMVGLPFEAARRRGGDRGADRADPRGDAQGGAGPRAHRAAASLREPLRAQAGHALPVAAHGGPEGDRQEAPVPAQGLREDAQRGRHPQERAHRGRPVGPGPGRPPHGRRPRGGGTRAHGLQARHARSRSRSRLLPLPGPGRDEVLPWDIVDNGVSRAYFLRELDKARQEALSPHCPEIQGCIRCGVCVDTPNPSYKLPEKWKHLGTSPRYLPVAR